MKLEISKTTEIYRECRRWRCPWDRSAISSGNPDGVSSSPAYLVTPPLLWKLQKVTFTTQKEETIQIRKTLNQWLLSSQTIQIYFTNKPFNWRKQKLKLRSSPSLALCLSLCLSLYLSIQFLRKFRTLTIINF